MLAKEQGAALCCLSVEEGLPTYAGTIDEFQEVKARLLASEGPTLRRHSPGEDAGKGPVLRRNRQYENELYESDVRTLPGLPNIPSDGNFGYVHH